MHGAAAPCDPRPPKRDGRQYLKRCAIKLVVLLALGAVVNVAVAWGCVLIIPSLQGRTRTEGWLAPSSPRNHRGRNIDHIVERAESLGNTRNHVYGGYSDQNGKRMPEAAAIVPYWFSFETFYDLSGEEAVMSVNASGWPFRCMLYRWCWTRMVAVDTPATAPDAVTFIRGIEIRDLPHLPPVARTDYLNALPCQPIWPGFVLNTFFYVVILWLLFAVPGVVRRRIRIKRGQCAACGYPVGVSSVCTECGVAVVRGEGQPLLHRDESVI